MNHQPPDAEPSPAPQAPAPDQAPESEPQFEIEFTRLKETAPDLRFTERFTWASGRSEVSIDMWWDEWFEDYRIAHIAACPCLD